MPIGELWDLEKLAEECKKRGRWTFFLTSSPLNLRGGVASPPNAMVSTLTVKWPGALLTAVGYPVIPLEVMVGLLRSSMMFKSSVKSWDEIWRRHAFSIKQAGKTLHESKLKAARA